MQNFLYVIKIKVQIKLIPKNFPKIPKISISKNSKSFQKYIFLFAKR